jgi:hypothetical protein
MLDLRWLSDQLCDALRWQLTNPGSEDGTSQPVSFGIDPAIELIETFQRTRRAFQNRTCLRDGINLADVQK